MQTKGNLFVISGPAGAGKSEIVKLLLKKHPDVSLSVSCTTRAMRPGEEEGKSYYFKSEEEFMKLVEQDAFYEWAHVHQNCYGTLKSAVADALDRGKDLILEIDVQGCSNVMKLNPDCTGIFVSPPSRRNLEERLRNRGTETEESIRVRLGNVASEIKRAYEYDYVIIHNDWSEVPNALEIAADEVYAIISAKRCEKKNRVEFLDGIMSDLTD